MSRLFLDHDARRAWALVGLGFVALALAFSARAALGLVMPIWEQEFGWSRSFISGGGALALIVMAVVAPVVGRGVDRQGPRRILSFGLLALALGSGLVALIDSRWLFLLAFGGISALGYGVVATHVVATAIAQRVKRRLGLAVGVATSGATAGQFLIMPLLAGLLAVADWRWSYLALALASLLLLPLLWCSLRAGPGQSAAVTPATERRSSSFLADARRLLLSPVFHLLFWSFLICGYTTTGVIETHLLPFAAFCGIPPLPSATAYGVLSAFNMLGMVLAGWLSDRVHRPLLLGGIYVVRAFTFILLVNLGSDLDTLLLFAVIFGLVDYATVPVTASLVASHLGLRVMGLAMGLISAGHSIGGALGAFLGGYLFDLYARYDWVWWSSLWLALVAGLMVFLIGERRPGEQSAQEA